MKKIIDYIRENKIILLILLITFLVLSYSSFNTFIANDDLPYSFFKRLDIRVTNLFQVIWDNLRYYKSTNGRFIVHVIVMTLLIFGKSLWSILNPLVITLIMFIIYKICCKKEYNNIKKAIIGLSIVSLYLLLYQYKGLFYWVAGSINYLWVSLAILIIVNIYLNKGLNKKMHYFMLFITSTLHENSFVFFITFVLVLNIIEYLNKKSFKYLKLFIPVILGGAVLLLAPGNLARTGSYDEWNQLSFLSKLDLSIPEVSKITFNLFDVSNLIPTIYIIILLIKLFSIKEQKKYKIIFSVAMLIPVLLTFFINFKYLYFIIAIISFLLNLFILYKDKEINLIPVHFGVYAVAFSMIITPLYYFNRSATLLMLYFIIIISKYLIDIMNDKKTLHIIACLVIGVVSTLLLTNEVIIYTNIGSIHKDRIKSIEEYKKNSDDNTLYLKTIPDKYAKYHIDSNTVDENHWSYKYFIWYYDIKDGTIIKYN